MGRWYRVAECGNSRRDTAKDRRGARWERRRRRLDFASHFSLRLANDGNIKADDVVEYQAMGVDLAGFVSTRFGKRGRLPSTSTSAVRERRFMLLFSPPAYLAMPLQKHIAAAHILRAMCMPGHGRTPRREGLI